MCFLSFIREKSIPFIKEEIAHFFIAHVMEVWSFCWMILWIMKSIQSRKNYTNFM